MNIGYWLDRWRGVGHHTFRSGPVPHTACRRASARGPFRAFQTAAEIRENAFVGRDPDCAEHRIRVRAKRTHGNDSAGLPYVFDDLRVGRRGDSWKHYRGQQSRRRGMGRPRADAGPPVLDHRSPPSDLEARASKADGHAGLRGERICADSVS